MFYAQATGNPTPTVQWQLSTGGSAFTPVPGATSSCFSLPASSSTNNDEVEAVFANSYGSATTDAATVTIATPYKSSNWSGYADVDPCANFSSVSGTWKVPTVSCTLGTQYSSVWVGIDGYSDATVEQDGTDSDCQNGVPQYYAWFEMYGDPAENDGDSVPLQDLVKPGDIITASVQESNDEWTLSLTDATEAWSFVTTIEFAGASLSSAEWIVERPELCDLSGCSLTDLANFGTISMTNAQASVGDGSGSGSVTAYVGDEIQMQDGSTSLASPGPLDLPGQAFSVAWDASD
jgi:hypothetical protein